MTSQEAIQMAIEAMGWASGRMEYDQDDPLGDALAAAMPLPSSPKESK